MPYIVISSKLFDGSNRQDSEQSILYFLEGVTDRNCRYLEDHPETPKLYDSKVVYALPNQITYRPEPDKIAALEQFLKTIGTDEETVDLIVNILHGVEMFRDIPSILAKGQVDCDNLACWRAAEIRRAGVHAMPYITSRETPDGTTYHALVRWPDNTTEDPSIILGMGGEDKARERAEEKRKNHERHDLYVQAAKLIVRNGHKSAVDAAQEVAAFGLLPRDGRW